MSPILHSALVLMAQVAVAAVPDAGPTLVHRVTDQGLQGWLLRQGAIEIEIIQRLPDQTRGFFLGRGFDADMADRIGSACVMQTIMRNMSQDVPIDVDLAEWRKSVAGDTSGVKLKRDWEQESEAADVSKAARIAFFWSLFPTRQHFEPGDYNWGMISFGLPPGAAFDLDLVWRESGEPRSARIEGIACAADR